MYDSKCKGPFQTVQPLILASKSPRRLELLSGLGLKFKVKEAGVKELDQSSGFAPEDMVLKNAKSKALKVAELFSDSFVIGADTCVFIKDKILGKPRDRKEAISMLELLSGNWHTVFTAFCIFNQEKKLMDLQVVNTKVLLHGINNDVIKAYCSTNEPYDKAGAYAVQAVGGFMVKEIVGSYTNVVGLPMSELVEALLRLGVIEPCVKS